MRRTGIKCKRSTPRAHKSADVLREFAETHVVDEVERFLVGPVWEQVCEGWHGGDGLLVHHIFHASKRCDLWHNLIRVSERAHHYIHKEPIGGCIACMAARLSISNTATAFLTLAAAITGKERDESIRDMRTAIRDEWREAFGRDAIGWLQAKRDAGDVPEHYVDSARGILELF